MIFIERKPKFRTYVLIISLLFLTSGASYASVDNSEPSIISGYFEPSGYYGNHAGYYQWVDYCPLCHHRNCLSNNPKGTYEGEITCLRCSADYDGTSGADKHGHGARAWLVPYAPREGFPGTYKVITPYFSPPLD